LPRACGIGIDVAEPDTFAHLDPAAIERAARRWLAPEERAWCDAQPCFRQAMVTVLSCKESVFKASDPVTLWWDTGSGLILTVGVAGPTGPARRLLSRIIRGRGGAEAL
jgi:hypothetical protein